MGRGRCFYGHQIFGFFFIFFCQSYQVVQTRLQKDVRKDQDHHSYRGLPRLPFLRLHGGPSPTIYSVVQVSIAPTFAR